MEKTIFLREVLAEMGKMENEKTPVPFSLKVRNFNKQNKSGGNLINYNNAVLMKPPKIKGAKRLAMDTDFKDPNHWENRTRNIKLETGEIKKIHTIYIVEFNGKKVIY